MKQTKIVATIGPASESPMMLEKLMRAGVNVCRLNFSHGSHASHAKLIKNIRGAAKKVGMHVGILADLQGPRIRLGELPQDGIKINVGDRIVFSTRTKVPAGMIPVTYENLHKDLTSGDRILIADGVMEVVVEKVKGQEITAKVTLGGTLKSHKGLNVPTATLHIPPITRKDRADAEFALSQGADLVALSFVMSAENVKSLRSHIKAVANKLHRAEIAATPIIVKIEKHEAVKNFDAILAEADGVMVARGDLALEINQAEVPSLQRGFIEKCRHAGKPVIVATQMLESMTENPRPTRAEISDVGHAVMDHTDATMLSGESAMGKYPVETVTAMSSIIAETETSEWDDVTFNPSEALKDSQRSWMGAVARLLADESYPTCIVVASATGASVRSVASFRPQLPIIAAVPSDKIAQRLALTWGVISIVIPKVKHTDELVKLAVKHMLDKKLIKKGQTYVMVSSDPLGFDHLTNVIALRKV